MRKHGTRNRDIFAIMRSTQRNIMAGIMRAGPVGIDSLAAALSEERGTLEDVIEPYLIQQGLIVRTPRGRVATNAAYRHFGLTAPTQSEPSAASSTNLSLDLGDE